MIYRRSEKEMTAYNHEFEFIKQEGVAFQFLTQPVRVIEDGGVVTGLECISMSLGQPDRFGEVLVDVHGVEVTDRAGVIMLMVQQDRSRRAGVL